MDLEFCSKYHLLIPEVLNEKSINKMEKNLKRLSRSEGDVIILKGSSPNTFCMGLDFTSLTANQSDVNSVAERFASILIQIRRTPKVVFAIVEGGSFGGGVGIAAAADFVIASKTAHFGLPEGIFGLVPGIILPFLKERVSLQRLRRWVMAGESIASEEAAQIGLIDSSVDEKEISLTLKRCIRRFSRLSKESVVIVKGELLGKEEELEVKVKEGVTFLCKRLQSPIVLARINAWQKGEPPWEI